MKKTLAILPLLAAVAPMPAWAQVSPRAEFRIGYDEVRAEVAAEEETLVQDFGVDGLGYGVEVGVDAFVTRSIMAGVYVGADLSNVDGCRDQIFRTILGPDERLDEICVDARTNFTAGGRLGLALPDGGVIYGKAGLSRGKFRFTYDDDTTVAGLALEGSDTLNGWHVGAGVELPIAGMVYVKGEYVYTDYKNAFRDELDYPNERLRPSRHQLLAGVGVRFGGPREVIEPVDTVVAPPPPPPPAPPATQTCPDGTVILATDACPPPPPPPAPAPGERG